MQKAVDDWFREIGAEYWKPESMGLRMAEEVGELCKSINNKYGDRPGKAGEEDNIKEELGDVLFTAVCIANKLEIDLTDAFELIMKKYKIRDNDRHN